MPPSDQNVHHARTQAWKIPPFSRILGKRKTPLFQPKSQNAILFSLYTKKYPLCESDITCIKHFFCVHRTNIFSLCLIWNEYLKTRSRSNVWKPGWKQADTCEMFTLFHNFPDLCLRLKNSPFFFAKVGTSVVYVLIGSGGGGVFFFFFFFLGGEGGLSGGCRKISNIRRTKSQT